MTYRQLLPELETYVGPGHEMLDEFIVQNEHGAWLTCSEYLANQQLRSTIARLRRKLMHEPQPIPYPRITQEL